MLSTHTHPSSYKQRHKITIVVTFLCWGIGCDELADFPGRLNDIGQQIWHGPIR